MIATVTNTISKGLKSTDNAYQFTWYKSNFNMPVPNVYSGTSYATVVQYLNTSTSYDLSGFAPGFEICVGTSVWDFENDGGTTYNVDTYLYNDWRDISNTTVLVWGANGFHVVQSIPAGYGYRIAYSVNIGCAPWEVSTSGTYHYRASASGTPSISTVDTSVTMSNVPSITTLSGKAGYIWVEGNNLAFVNANSWKHSITGLDGGYVGGTPGYFWCDTTNTINWIGSNGHRYTIPWVIKQFASTFSNGATGSTYAGTANGGKIWVDNEFGDTHLAFINPNDGYKYLCGAGDYPY